MMMSFTGEKRGEKCVFCMCVNSLGSGTFNDPIQER